MPSASGFSQGYLRPERMGAASPACALRERFCKRDAQALNGHQGRTSGWPATHLTASDGDPATLRLLGLMTLTHRVKMALHSRRPTATQRSESPASQNPPSCSEVSLAIFTAAFIRFACAAGRQFVCSHMCLIGMASIGQLAPPASRVATIAWPPCAHRPWSHARPRLVRVQAAGAHVKTA